MPTTEERLAELLIHWDDARVRQPDVRIETFCAAHDATDLVGEFRAMVACFDSLHLVEDTDPAHESHGETPPSNGRFKVKEVLGRGGLGVVYLAQDEQLERDVALKTMRSVAASDPTARERFVREAKVTGRLDHPGVVAVHDLVRDATGNICYTMRLIGGSSMRDAIDHYHQAGRDPGELRRLLRAFGAACDAVAYAHSKGIVHRDLKPHNIMLGAYGETLVIDWGLALERGSHAPHGDQPTKNGDDHGGTVTGRAMGTWGYMSPEQGRGDWAHVGPASDIFSLGATLYHVLAGRPPYVGDDVQANVLACRYPPVSSMPKALAAISERAMAPNPAARYGDARDLARDVERWLADEHVTAYRDPLPVRARRWAKRHRSLVASGVALLVTAVIGLSTGLYFVNREKNRTERERLKTKEALDQTEIARKETKAALDRVSIAQQRTRKALEETTDIAVERQLTGQRKLTAGDRAFLTRALNHYREFAAEVGETRQAREDVAHAHFRVAYINARLGHRLEAEANYRNAEAAYSALARDMSSPEREEIAYSRARTRTNLALLLATSGRGAAARELYDELATELPQLLPYLQGEDAIKARQTLAYVRNGLGRLQLAAGQRTEAVASFKAGAEIHADLMRLEPENPEHAGERARALANVAMTMQTYLGRNTDAAKMAQESRELLTRLMRQFPDEPDYTASMAKNMIVDSTEAMVRFQLVPAQNLLRDAIRLMRPIVRDFPSDVEYRLVMAEALRNLALSRHRFPDGRDEADASFKEALEILDRLVEADPMGIDQRFSRGLTRYGRANTLVKLDPSTALKLYDGAFADLRAVIEGDNGGRIAPPLLPMIHWNRANLALQAGDHGKAALAASEVRRLALSPATGCADAAQFLSRAIRVAATDQSLAWWQWAVLGQRYANDAMASLSAAVSAGFKDAARLRNADFAPLQSRADFQKLVQRLEMK